ncbi:hypothetical protein ACLOJK_020506 [Asimina triloba]
MVPACLPACLPTYPKKLISLCYFATALFKSSDVFLLLCSAFSKKLIGCARCRLKLLRSKRDAIVRHVRADIAQLLRGGHQQTAFFRVEQLVNDQSILAAYDLLDHYCEFILLNLPYIRKHRDCPNDIKEAISSLIFAAARCADLPELQTLRELFGKRYGNDFVMAAGQSFPGNLVNQQDLIRFPMQITEKLSTRSVSDDERFELIEEIAVEYDIQLWQPEIGDGSNQQYQTDDIVEGLACDPRCEQGIDVLEKDIQVVYSDISRVEMWASNDEEMWNLPQRKHTKKSLPPQSQADSHNSSSRSEQMLAKSYLSCSSSENTSDLVTAASIQRRPDDGKKPKTSEPQFEEESNQGTRCIVRLSGPPSRQSKVERTTSTSTESSTRLLESIMVCLDDLDDFHRSKRASKRCKDRKWLAREGTQDPVKIKNEPARKSFQSVMESEKVGSHKEGRKGNSYDKSHCRTSNSSAAIFSDAADYDPVKKHKKLIRTQHEISTAHSYGGNRKKPVEQTLRKRSIDGQSQQRRSFAGSGYEFDEFLGTSGSLSPESHIHDSTMPVTNSIDDVECALYYDEACDCSDSNPPNVHRDKTKEKSVHFISRCNDVAQKKHRRQISSEGSENSILRRSRNAKKSPSPQQSNFHSKKKPVKEIRNHSQSHIHNSARKSYSSYNCRHGTFADCSLDRPCYFLTSDEKDDWGSPSKCRAFAGKRACNLQQEQESHQDVPDCAATSCSKTSVSSVANVGNDKQEQIATSRHQKLQANLNRNAELHTDVKHRTSFQGFVNARAGVFESYGHSGMQMSKAAKPSEDVTKGSSLSSYSTETQTQSLKPPYERAMTMPLQGRPKINTTDQNLRSSSFQFKQENKPSGHVHPKLPDYDDLAAKFTALRKAHSQQNAMAQAGYA